ncbi:hypothetical protein FALCPG4_013977 [Fusarium falciforme]
MNKQRRGRQFRSRSCNQRPDKMLNNYTLAHLEVDHHGNSSPVASADNIQPSCLFSFDNPISLQDKTIKLRIHLGRSRLTRGAIGAAARSSRLVIRHQQQKAPP